MIPMHSSATSNIRAHFTKPIKGYHAVPMGNPIIPAPKNSRWEDQDLMDLLEVVKLNNLKQCKNLLNNEICLKEKDTNFLSHPLVRAAKNGHHEILELLLEKGADINVQFDSNSSALHLAIRYHHELCSLTLLQKGIKFNELRDKEGNLAIHLAASEGDVTVVKWMLEHEQDLNVINDKEQTPLHLSLMKKDHDELIKLLLNSRSTIGQFDIKDCNLRVPLHYAVDNGYQLCCDRLLEHYPEHAFSSDIEGDTPLILAARKGYAHCLKSLCSTLEKAQTLSMDGLNKVNSLGNTALHYAATNGFIEIIKILHDAKADFSLKDKKGNTAAHISANHEDLECFKYIINNTNKCPGVNNLKRSLWHLLVLNSWEEPLKHLLQKDISFKDSINFQDIKNQTALHLAILKSSEACIDVLLLNGADFSLPDDEGNTPLHLAASKGLMKTCEWILQGEGTQMINLKNKGGDTPLHLATSKGSLSCCNLLLSKGANIHIKNNKGFSSYQESAGKGKLDILKLFTKYKRSLIKIKVEGSGDTILDIAARNGHYECCEYILGNIKRNLILSSLYEAFNSENDDIFKLILPRCILSKQKSVIVEFKAKLHDYMHKALAKEKQRPIIQQAIIESDWWFYGFSSCFCSEGGQCGNFFNLTKSNPEFAKLVLDRCIVNFEEVDVYDFRLFEQDFYVEIPDKSKSAAMKVAPPYEPEIGEFLQKSLRHNGGCQESALMEALYKGSRKVIQHPLVHGYRKVIQHPLVDGYWEYKWKKYLIYILMALLAIHVLITTALSLYLVYSWNWAQVSATLQTLNNKLQQNGSDPIPYSILGNCSVDIPRVLEMPEINFQFLNFLRFCLLAVTIFSFVAEYHMLKKFDFKSYMTLGAILRNCRLVLIVFLILPMTSCHDHIWILMTWQWLSGIIALLMSWFHMIYMLNKFPLLSVFLPITSKFAKSFFLALLYILLIVFIFAFIFYLLFNNHPAFANVGVAFVKSIVWIMGDLAYDDMFLNDDKPILYFAFSNVIFIVFVTSISGFIVNLIITQPTEEYQSFESDAVWYRDSNRIRMLLKFDNFHHNFRKQNTIIFWAKGKETDTEFMRRFMKLHHEDVPPKTKLKLNFPESDSGDLRKQMEILISEIRELKRNLSNEE